MYKVTNKVSLNESAIVPVHETVALPVNPGLHLQTKWPGRLQHSAFSAHNAANDGISHSLMSVCEKNSCDYKEN